MDDAALADDVLQESLLRALEQSENLRRGESAVAWFYRILRNAITDHYRKKRSESRRMRISWPIYRLAAKTLRRPGRLGCCGVRLFPWSAAFAQTSLCGGNPPRRFRWGTQAGGRARPENQPRYNGRAFASGAVRVA